MTSNTKNVNKNVEQSNEKRIESASKKMAKSLTPEKNAEEIVNEVIKETQKNGKHVCTICGSVKTAKQTNGKERWFSFEHGGFSKIADEKVVCESCQRKNRLEVKALAKKESAKA